MDKDAYKKGLEGKEWSLLESEEESVAREAGLRDREKNAHLAEENARRTREIEAERAEAERQRQKEDREYQNERDRQRAQEQRRLRESLESLQEASEEAEDERHQELIDALQEQVDEYEFITANADVLKADAKVGRGDGLLRAGLRAEALELYKQALALDPGHFGAHCGMAASLLQEGMHDLGTGYVLKCIKLIPGPEQAARALHVLRLVQRYHTDNAEALALCRQVLKLEPRNVDAQLCMAEWLAQSGKHDIGIGYVLKCIELIPGPEQAARALHVLTLVQRYYTDNPEALELCRQVLKLEPRNVDAQLCMGEWLAQSGKHDIGRVYLLDSIGLLGGAPAAAYVRALKLIKGQYPKERDAVLEITKVPTGDYNNCRAPIRKV